MIATKSNKYYECTSCGQKSFKWLGQCPNSSCKKWNTMEERLEQKKNYSIPKVSAKRKEEMKNEPIDTKLDLWFEEKIKWAIETGNHFCMETGENILRDLQSEETWIRRRCICHIVPKSKFPSVATHPDNFIILAWNPHHTFDSAWSNAREMKVWETAYKKVRGFFFQIQEKTGILPFEFVPVS